MHKYHKKLIFRHNPGKSFKESWNNSNDLKLTYIFIYT
ncbi:hypothetical protein LINPERHAP1_LOCUS28733 [Linum perenne]